MRAPAESRERAPSGKMRDCIKERWGSFLERRKRRTRLIHTHAAARSDTLSLSLVKGLGKHFAADGRATPHTWPHKHGGHSASWGQAKKKIISSAANIKLLMRSDGDFARERDTLAKIGDTLNTEFSSDLLHVEFYVEFLTQEQFAFFLLRLSNLEGSSTSKNKFFCCQSRNIFFVQGKSYKR